MRETSDLLPLACAQPGTWPATQARALTGNPTGDHLILRPALNPLSHTSQSEIFFFKILPGDNKPAHLHSKEKKTGVFNIYVICFPYSIPTLSSA